QEERAALLASSPEHQALLRVTAELNELRTAVGLDREEARLEELTRQQGRHTGRAGASFEELALELTRSRIAPGLLPRGEEAPGGLRVLRGVTLGAARTEFDQLVVRPRGDQPVQVLAVVEVKRNVNDLAHGFRLRQENLAWLTGDVAHYDPT